MLEDGGVFEACLTIPGCVLEEPVASSTVVHKNHHCQGEPADSTVSDW